jgi:pyruvate dehydrogenase E1 component alpha subunit
MVHDPITIYRGRLERLGADQALLDGIEKHVREAVDQATAEAIDGSPPAPESALTNVWADGGSSWRN